MVTIYMHVYAQEKQHCCYVHGHELKRLYSLYMLEDADELMQWLDRARLLMMVSHQASVHVHGSARVCKRLNNSYEYIRYPSGSRNRHLA